MPNKVTVTYDVYTFDELSPEAQDAAINDEINWWVETAGSVQDCPPEITRAFDKAEQMQTPWFAGEYIMEYLRYVSRI
jgi:hypothetical protein